MKARESCGLLMLYLLAEVAAVPVETQQLCTATCTETESSKFRYQPGTSYTYKYETEIGSFAQRESSQTSTLKMQATVHIDVITKCNLMLKLESVALTAGDEHNDQAQLQYFKSHLEAHPLMFGFQDGRIEAICHVNEDPVWVVNVKRGILSTFQNSMQSIDAQQIMMETDVTGKCPTTYTVSEEGIKKEKNLNECTDRNHYYGPLHTPSDSNSLLKSTQKCHHVISEGILIKATCNERHEFQPFAQDESHVTSYLQQTLTFHEAIRVHSQFPGFPVATKSSLLFHHTLVHFGQTSARNEAERTLRELCTVTSDGIGISVPGLFATFVQKLRYVEEYELQSMFQRLGEICPESEKIRKIFLDGLQMTQSPASVNLMFDCLRKGEISQTEAKPWFRSLAFISNPTKPMITNIAALQESFELDQAALLGVSSLVHTYCNINNCEGDSDVKKLVEKYVRILGNDCQIRDDSDYLRKMVALKAIGNTGASINVIHHLEKCFAAPQNPVEIRITAIDALRRLPCEAKNDLLWKIYSDFEVNSEVRIAAFKMLMKCPTPELIADVEGILKREEVNQVGSYVWTYLTNAQESIDPCKREIRKILYSELLKKKFSTDLRKFSRAFEGSAHSDALNAGVHADGDIIFPTNSFLPHSAYFNLTVDVLGNSINLFEVGGYAEGLEHLVQAYLGSQTDTQPTKDPEASLYVRVFGNDLHYLSTKEKMNNDKNLHSMLNQLMNNKEVEISKNVMFMNAGLVIPTISGFPLSLSVNGTASVDLQAKGHLNFHQLRENNANITAYFKPNAAVQIVGTMAVDAFVKKSGTKLVASLQTSVPLSGKVELKHGQLISVRLNVPEQKVEVFDINSELFLLNGNHEELLDTDSNSHKLEHCTEEATSYLFGMKACSIIEYSNPTSQDVLPFPLNGHSRAAISIFKSDPTLTHYLFEYKANNNQHSNNDFTRYMTLNTPGSTTDREFTGDVAIDFINHSIKTKLITPFKKIGFEGKFHFDKNLKYVGGSLNMDGTPIVALNASSVTTNLRDTTRHQHQLGIELGGETVIALTGHTTSQSGHKYAMDYMLHHLTKQPITFSGNAAHTSTPGTEKCDIDVTLKALRHTIITKGTLKKSNSTLTSLLAINHITPNQEATGYELVMKRRDVTNQNTRKTVLSATLKGTYYKPLSVILSYYQRMTTIKTQLDLSRGDGDQKKTLSLQNTLSYGIENNHHNVTAMFSAECDKCGVNYHISFSHHYNGTSKNTEFRYLYTVDRKLTSRWLASKLPLNNKHIYLSSSITLTPYETDWTGTYQWDSNQPYKGHVNVQAYPETGYGLQLDFIPPNASPMNFKGHYQSGPHRYVRSELDYGGKKYSVQMNQENVDSGYKIKAEVDLFNRHYSSELLFDLKNNKGQVAINFGIDEEELLATKMKYEYTGQKFYFNFDYKINENKYSFSTKYEKNNSAHNIDVILTLPQKKYQLTFTTRTETKVNSRNIVHATQLVLKLPHNVYQLSLNSATKGVLFSCNFTHVSEFKYLLSDELVFGSSVNMTHYASPESQEDFYYVTTATTYREFKTNVNVKLMYDPQSGWKAGFFSSLIPNSISEEAFNVDATLYFRSVSDLLNKFKFEMTSFIPRSKHPYHVTLTHDVQNNAIRTILRLGPEHETTVVSFNGNFAKTNSKFDVGGEYRLQKLRHSTPTQNFYISLTTSVETSSSVWNVEGKLDIDGKVTSIAGDLQLDPTNSFVSFTFETPWISSKTIQMTAWYKIDDTNFQTFLDVNWNDVEKINLEITLTKEDATNDHNMKHGSRVGVFHVTCTKGDVDVLLTYSHDFDHYSFKNAIELKWKINHSDLQFALKTDFDTNEGIKLDVELLTPLHAIRQIGFKILIRGDREFKLELLHNFSKFSLDFRRAIEFEQSNATLLTMIQLKTPFHDFKETSLHIVQLVSMDGRFDNYWKLEFQNREYSLHRHGVFNFKFKDLLYNFHLKTPFDNLKDFQLHFMYNLTSSSFKHHSSVSWNQRNSYSFSLQGRSSATDLYEGEFQIVTPTKTYGPFHVTLSIPSSPGQFGITANVKYETDEYFTLEYRNNNRGSKQAVTLSMSSSIPALEKLSFAAERSTDELLDINITTQWNEKFSVQMNIKGYATLAQSDLKISLLTPFYNTVMHMNHHVELQIYHIDIERSDGYSFKILHKLDGVKRIGYIDVKTPYHKIGCSFHATIAPSKYEVHWRLYLNDDEIKGQIVLFTLSSLSTLHLEVHTPFHGYRHISTTLKSGLRNIEPELFYFKAQIEHKDVEFKLNMLNDELALTLFSEYHKINTGMQVMLIKTFNLIDHQNTFYQTTEIKMKLYFIDFVTEGSFKYLLEENHIVAKLKTPFRGYETLELRGNMQTEPDNRLINVTVSCNEQWVRISASNKQTHNDAAEIKFLIQHLHRAPIVALELTYDVTTPAKRVQAGFQILQHRLRLTSSLVTEFTDMQLSTEFSSKSHDQNNFHVKWNLNLQPRELKGAMLLNASGSVFDDDKNHVFKFNYTLRGRDKKAEVFVHHGDYLLQGTTDANKRNRKFHLKILTPVSGYERMILNVNYNTPGNNKANRQVLNVKVNFGQEVIELKGRDDSDRSKQKMILALTSSFRGFEKQELHATYKIENDKKSVVVDLETPQGKFQIEGSVMLSETSGKCSFKVNDDTETLMAIEGQYDISANVQADLILHVYQDKTQLSLSFVPASNLHEIKLQLTTPYEGFENMGAAIDYYKQSDRNQIDLRGSITVWPNPRDIISLKGKVIQRDTAINGEIEYVNPLENRKMKMESNFDWGRGILSVLITNNEAKKFEFTIHRLNNLEKNFLGITIHPPIFNYKGIRLLHSNNSTASLAEYNRRESSTSLEIDILSDNDEQVSFQGSYGARYTITSLTSTRDCNFEFNLRMGTDEVKLLFEFKNNESYELDKKEITGKIEATIPFSRYQTFKLEGKSVDTNNSLAIDLNGKVNDETALEFKGLKIQEVDHTKLQIELKTLFKLLQSTGALVVKDLRSQEKNALIRLHLNDQHLGAGFQLQTEPTSDKPILTADVTWSTDKKLQLILAKTKSELSTDLQLRFLTPFTNCETNSLTLSYSVHDWHNAMGSLSGQACLNRAILRGRIQTEGTKSTLSIDLNNGVRSITNVIAVYNRNDMKHEINSDIHWGGNNTINVQGVLNDGDVRTGYLTIVTPFERFQRTSVRFSYSKKPKQRIASISIEPPSSRRLQFNIEGDFVDIHHFSFNSTLRLPLRGFELVRFSARHHLEDKSEGFVNAGWKRNKNVNVAWDVGKKSLGVVLETPFESLKSINISGSTSFKKRAAFLKWEVNWKSHQNSQKLGSIIAFSHNLPEDLMLTIRLYTSFQQFQNLNLEVKHSNRDSIINSNFVVIVPYLISKTTGDFMWKTVDTDKEFSVIFKTGESKIKTSGILKIDLPRSLKGDVKFDTKSIYMPLKAIVVDYANTQNRNIRAALRIDTQRASHAYVATYNKEQNKVNIELNADWPSSPATRKQIGIKGTMEYGNNGVGNGSFEIVFPDSEHKLDTKFVVSEHNTKGTFSISSDRMAMKEVQGDFNIDVQKSPRGINEIQALLRFATPIYRIENIGFKYKSTDLPRGTNNLYNLLTELLVKTVTDEYKENFSCDWDTTKKQCGLHIEFPQRSGKITLDSHLLQGPSSRLKLIYSTPTSKHQIYANLLNSADKTFKADMLVTSTMFQSSSSVNGSLQVEGIADHKTFSLRKLVTVFKAQQLNELHNFSVTYINNYSTFYSGFTFKNPHHNWDFYVIHVTEYNPEFKLSLDISSPNSKHFAIYSYKPTTHGFTAEVKIQCPLLHSLPIELFTDMKFAKPLILDAVWKITIGRHIHHINANIFNDANTLTAKFNTESTAEQSTYSRTMTSTISWKGSTIYDIELYAHVSLNGDDYKLIAQSHGNRRAPLMMQLKIETPLRFFNEFEATMRLDTTTSWKLNFDVYYTSHYQRRSFQTTIEQTSDSFFMQTLLDLGFTDPLGLSFGGHYNNAAGNGQVTVTHGGKEYRTELNFLNVAHNHGDASISLSFPINNEKQSIKAIMNYNNNPESGFTGKIEINTSFKNYKSFTIQTLYSPKWQKGEFMLNVQTPFHNFETIVVRTLTTVDYQNFTRHFRCKISLPSKEYEIVTTEINRRGLDMSFAFGWKVDEKLTVLRTVIRTFPYQQFLVSLTDPEKEIFSGHVTWLKFQNTTLEIKGSYYEQTFGFGFNKSDDKVQFEVRTPFKGYELISANADWKMTNAGYDANVRLNIRQETYHANIVWGDKMLGLEVKTPLNKLKDIKIEISYKNDVQIDVKDNGVQIVKLQIPMTTSTGTFRLIIFDRSMHVYFQEAGSSDNRSQKIVVGKFCFHQQECITPDVRFRYRHDGMEGNIVKNLILEENGKTIDWTYSIQKLPHGVTSKSKIQWGESQYEQLGYNFLLTTQTDNSVFEQNAILKLHMFSRDYEISANRNFDRRNRNAAAYLLLKWYDKERTMQTSGFKYIYEATSPSETVVLLFVHPALEKDISIRLEQEVRNQHYQGNLLLDYSTDKQHQLHIEMKKWNHSPERKQWELTMIHLPSNMNTSLSFETADDPQHYMCTLELHHRDRLEQQHNYKGTFQYSKEQKQATLIVNMNDNTLHMTGIMSSTSREAGLLLTTRWNSQAPTTARLQFLKHNPEVILNVVYDAVHQKQFIVSMGLPTPTLLNFVITHGNNTNQIKDVDFSFMLQSGNSLNSRLKWRPETAFTVMDTTILSYRSVQRQYENVQHEIRQEIDSKTENFMNEMQKIVDPITIDVMEDFKKDVLATYEASYKTWQYSELYSRYLRYILDHYSEWCTAMCKYAESLVRNLPGVAKTTWNKILTIQSYIGTMVENFLECLHTKARSYAQNAAQVVMDIHYKLFKMAFKSILLVNDHLVQPILEKWIYPIAKQMQDRAKELIYHLYSLALEVIADPNLISSVHHTFRTCCEGIARKFTKTFQNGVTHLTEIMNHSYMKHAINFITSMFNMMDTIIMNGKASSLLRQLHGTIETETYNIAYDVLIAYPKLQFDTSHTVVYNPADGLVEYNQHLPITWSNFKEFPNFEEVLQLKHLSQWRDHIFNHINELSSNVYKRFYS